MNTQHTMTMGNTTEDTPSFSCDRISNGEAVVSSIGMSLRDYFAAKAMQGYIACGGMTKPCDGAIRPFNENEVACFSFAMADAMLAERNKA